MNLKERVEWVMHLTRWSKSELARRANVSRAAPTDWTKGGVQALSAEVAYRLAQATGFDAMWLATGDGEKPTEYPVIREALQGDRKGGKPSGFDVNVSPAKRGDRRIPLSNYVQAGQLTEIGAGFSGEAMEYLLTDLDLSEH